MTFFHQNASAAQAITRMRLVDMATGADVVIGQSRGTLVENGCQINNVVGMIFGRLVPARAGLVQQRRAWATKFEI
ncbi:hypothetical protein [Methylorubrum extorquens]|uniref:hypothetical protein n=1 Tax=Methylorubrum extorquens TaxID=408 RepID=UPI00209F9B43|nr:hypothetical protein [Methylorubrum extorquens]MCP1539538.1 hypothetical protein [Methylorubrum extorquens]